MEWPASFLGSTLLESVQLELPAATAAGQSSGPSAGGAAASRPNLSEEALAAWREVKKSKSEPVQLMLSVGHEALKGEPLQPGGSSRPLYQPIGKIVYANPFAVGSAVKKSHLFCYVATEDGSRVGGPNAKYRW